MSETVPCVAVPVEFPMDVETEGIGVFQNNEVIAIRPRSKIPRPPNAFMIFANEWRKIFATQFPSESNKNISIRLGQKWKSLDNATKEIYFQAARRVDAEHKLKFPNYIYNPKEARLRKAIRQTCRGQGSKRGRKPKSYYNQQIAFLVPENVRTDKHTTEIPFSAEMFRELNKSQSTDKDERSERRSEQFLVIDERKSLSSVLAKVAQENGSRIIIAPAFGEGSVDFNDNPVFQASNATSINPVQEIIITDAAKLAPHVIQNLHNDFGKLITFPEISSMNKNKAESSSENTMAVRHPKILNSSQMVQFMQLFDLPTKGNNCLPVNRILNMNDVILCSNIQPKTEVSANNISRSEDSNDPLNVSLPELNPYGLTQQMLSTTPCMTSLISEDFSKGHDHAMNRKCNSRNIFQIDNENLTLHNWHTVKNDLFRDDCFRSQDGNRKFTKGEDRRKTRHNSINVTKNKYEPFSYAETMSPLDLTTSTSLQSPIGFEQNYELCSGIADGYINEEVVLDLSTRNKNITGRLYESEEEYLNIKEPALSEHRRLEMSLEEETSYEMKNSNSEESDSTVLEYKSSESEQENLSAPEKNNVFDELFRKMSEDFMPLDLSLNGSRNRQAEYESFESPCDEYQKEEKRGAKLNESEETFQRENFKNSTSLKSKTLDNILKDGRVRLNFPHGTPNILKKNVHKKQRTPSEDKSLFEKFALSTKTNNFTEILKNCPTKNEKVEIPLIKIIKKEDDKNNENQCTHDREQEDLSFKVRPKCLKFYEKLKVESPDVSEDEESERSHLKGAHNEFYEHYV